MTTPSPTERPRSSATILVDLPPELLTAICVLVGCPTIAGCRLVCRRLRDLVDASLELQYHIELARDGMTDLAAPDSPTPHATPTASLVTQTTAARLARLRALRRAWSTLGWTRCVTVPMPGPCCAYELVGGIFCKTQPTVPKSSGVRGYLPVPVHFEGAGDGDGDWDGEEALVHGSRAMSLTWLPGPGARDAGRRVVRDDLGVPTRDFALDPAQDLMVLFKSGEDPGPPTVTVYPGVLELHVRTMSTHGAHPGASLPVLSTPVLYPVTSVFLQIVDDVVGMMYCVDPARPLIAIWNWRTGRLVVDRPSGSLPPGTWDFSFVHSRALFVTSAEGGGSLELFTFSCDPVETGPAPNANANANTYDRTRTDALVHVATLCLPAIHPSVRVLSISTHTGPFMGGCPPGTAFVSSNAARVHVLTVQYVHLPTLEGPRTRPRVGMVVHQRALETFLARGAAAREANADEPVLRVPWDAWGRTHARTLLHVGMFQWLRYVHGQRFVMLSPTSQAGKSTLQVLDFNVRRAWEEGECELAAACKTSVERVDRPTRLVMPNIFVDVVESGLPYREARRDVRGDYSGVMIDDERLVGLKYPAFLTGDMKEIDVFTM